MSKRPQPESIRRLDGASLALLLVGVFCLGLSIGPIHHGMTFLVAVPSLCAIVTGARNLTKWEAPR